MTTTSYAILGLLAIKPWTTYELIQQVERSLRRVWPRAQSKLYEEPKKLVALGYASASEEQVGRRRRTWYTITPAGRAALATWLAEPGGGPVLEFEQLLKIHLAHGATTAAIRTNLAATLQWVHAQNEENLATARAYLAGEGPFPQRTAVNMLAGRFLTDFYAMVADWARWAARVVDDRPDDPDRARDDEAVLREIDRVAESVGTPERGDAERDGPAR